DCLRQPDALDEVKAKPAEHGRTHPLGMRKRQKRGVSGAHGVTHHVRTTKAEMVEERTYIVSHDGAVIGSGVIELCRLAMTAIVERDDAAPGARERGHPAGKDPIHLLVGRKAMHEHNRLALAFVEKGNFHVVMREARHAVSRASRRSGRPIRPARWSRTSPKQSHLRLPHAARPAPVEISECRAL